MFKANQITSATQLIKNFRQLSWELATQRQAILIIQKKGEHLVLLNVESFKELIKLKFNQMDSLPDSSLSG